MEATGKRTANAQQQAVIDELERNIILYASAGTGKTFTVARRVENILACGRAKPEEILCLTFTIKAADEMRTDILDCVGEEGKQVLVSTIHSFAYRVLREESLLNPETGSLPGICDDSDEEEALKSLLRELITERDFPMPKFAKDLSVFASELKHERERQNQYSEDEEKDFQELYNACREDLKSKIRDGAFLRLMNEYAGKLMHAYNDFLRASNLLDFDDLICETHRLFRQEESCERWRSRFRYLIIDEMQDTSEMEYDTIRRLFPGNHVMMCGDFFQTIYEWRGSRPELILDSYQKETDARCFWFSLNYRSTRLLTHASFGYLKNSFPELMGVYGPDTVSPQSETEGERILNLRLSDLKQEADMIYKYWKKCPPSDPAAVCVMARSNGYIAKLYNELMKISQLEPEEERLRFFTVDREAKFFRRAAVRDLLSFWHVVLNGGDELHLKRIADKYITGMAGNEIPKKLRKCGRLGLSLSSFTDEKSFLEGDPYGRLLEACEEDNLVIYDTETTGLDLGRDEIIQISAIRLSHDGRILAKLDQMVIPTVPICKEAQATHHQSLESIIERGGIDTKSALERFSEFVRGSVLVGHNSLCFDAPLLRRQLRECGLSPLQVIAEYDTLNIARQVLAKSPNYKLDTLCKRFGIVNECAHDALGDITATGKVLLRLLEEAIRPNTEQRREILTQYLPNFRKFYDFLTELRRILQEEGDLYRLTEQIIDRCRLRSFHPEAVHQQDLDDLLFAMKGLHPEDPVGYLRDFLANASLSGSQMDLLIKKLKKIPVITVHQSKGCEFDTVILAGADEKNFPITWAQNNPAKENEEKRVFYVAISRAKRRLILTSTYQSKGYYERFEPLGESPYIQKIPEEDVQPLYVRP